MGNEGTQNLIKNFIIENGLKKTFIAKKMFIPIEIFEEEIERTEGIKHFSKDLAESLGYDQNFFLSGEAEQVLVDMRFEKWKFGLPVLTMSEEKREILKSLQKEYKVYQDKVAELVKKQEKVEQAVKQHLST